MYFLNLSPTLNFEPALTYASFVFNGGEPHIKISPTDAERGKPVCITVQARSANDLLMALLAKDALSRMGFGQVDLFIPYFPAARQDRVMVPGEPLTVKVFAAMINAAGFSKVTVFDAHSEVTAALLDRCQAIQNHAFIKKITETIPNPSQLTLIAPDAGAAKKIHHLASAIGWERVVQCDKVRDVKTGKLSAPQVFSDDLKGADCLIVDDICDGGGTFIQLAESLRAKNAGRLFLAVSHGIFSKGVTVLTDVFDGVFTTNSFYNESETEKLTIIQLPAPL